MNSLFFVYSPCIINFCVPHRSACCHIVEVFKHLIKCWVVLEMSFLQYTSVFTTQYTETPICDRSINRNIQNCCYAFFNRLRYRIEKMKSKYKCEPANTKASNIQLFYQQMFECKSLGFIPALMYIHIKTHTQLIHTFHGATQKVCIKLPFYM